MSIAQEHNITGLSTEEASRRLKQDGLNELPSAKPRNFIAIITGILKEPMFLLLIATASLYIIIGDLQEGLSLMVAILAVIGITFYQERKTERALDALRELAGPQAFVIRDGIEKQIAGTELVRGDVIIVREGGRIPADALVLHTRSLSVDESVLTGESVPVSKTEWVNDTSAKNNKPGGEGLPNVYSGTLVVSGQGVAQVYSTGLNTEIGKIGASLGSIIHEDTLLKKEIGRIVRLFAVLGVALCAILLLVYGFYYNEWLKGTLAGLTLAMAMLPEEFPVVLTVFLALGAWRISRKKVLTRKGAAIETLGAATVLCVDKTGTITFNSMKVVKLYVPDVYWNGDVELPEAFHTLAEYAILASQKDPFDPTEKAIHVFGEEKLNETERLHKDWQLAHEYALTPGFLCMSEVWRSKSSGEFIIAAKGAPETIFDLCHISTSDAEKYENKVHELASEGLRVLGVARAKFSGNDFPENQQDFSYEFLGLVALADPVRPGVAAALQECYSAGIKLVMITGDYPATAKNIAQQIGIKNANAIITGEQLDAMTDEELRREIENLSVFSRVVPTQKLRIVNALKTNNEVVAMTGDGVNDAPALKAAHIGISMGKKGTDVAREASDMVLLNDDFNALVGAIRMGRRIFDNLQKAMMYIISIHVPIAGLSLIPAFLPGYPLLLFPVHIAFFELVTDPVYSIVFEAEPEEKNIMQRPPRSLNEPLFGWRRILVSILQGLSILIIVFAVYLFTNRLSYSEEDVRTIAFCSLILCYINLLFTNISRKQSIFSQTILRNKMMFYILGATMLFFILVLYVPVVQQIFHFSTLHPNDLIISFAAGAAGVLWFEAVKFIQRKFNLHI